LAQSLSQKAQLIKPQEKKERQGKEEEWKIGKMEGWKNGTLE
jgi:hypothetical protein